MPEIRKTDPKQYDFRKNSPKKKVTRSTKGFGGSGRKFLKYPIANSMGEKTGDRLLIKCVQFEPPAEGKGVDIKTKGLFKYDGKKFAGVIKEGDMINGKVMKAGSLPPIEIRMETSDANKRLSQNMNSRTKYMIELPIPQDLSDSNSVTWGEDLSLIHI